MEEKYLYPLQHGSFGDISQQISARSNPPLLNALFQQVYFSAFLLKLKKEG